MKRFTSPVVDCHQHLWPASFVEALRQRCEAPRLDGWTLHLAGEPPYSVDPDHHDLDRRLAQDHADGVERTLYSLSSPLGIELMRPDGATPLLSAWHDLAAELPETAGLWAAACLTEPDPELLRTTLAAPGVVGLQVPANALATPTALEQLAPLLEVVEAADRPVLVHPGPARSAGPGLPTWWPALTDYPAQMNAAWHAWHAAGRSLLPRLRIGFVALAGLAPLHHERLDQRGGRFGRVDHDVFYETSSYGPRAVDSVARVVGIEVLVHGSDRPYARSLDPGLGAAFAQAVRRTNPQRFLEGESR